MHRSGQSASLFAQDLAFASTDGIRPSHMAGLSGWRDAGSVTAPGFSNLASPPWLLTDWQPLEDPQRQAAGDGHQADCARAERIMLLRRETLGLLLSSPTTPVSGTGPPQWALTSPALATVQAAWCQSGLAWPGHGASSRVARLQIGKRYLGPERLPCRTHRASDSAISLSVFANGHDTVTAVQAGIVTHTTSGQRTGSGIMTLAHCAGRATLGRRPPWTSWWPRQRGQHSCAQAHDDQDLCQLPPATASPTCTHIPGYSIED